MSGTPTHYELLGGESGVRQLVDRFYDLMDSAPEAQHVRALHAASLKASREKLFLYLSYWTGGPPTYVERNGHPMLRARHLPFRITSRERDEWLWCMHQAIDEHPMPDELKSHLRDKLVALADHMRNTPDVSPGLPVL
jgi:hemoglobin